METESDNFHNIDTENLFSATWKFKMKYTKFATSYFIFKCASLIQYMIH